MYLLTTKINVLISIPHTNIQGISCCRIVREHVACT